jgi:hypothetical protein
MKGFEDNKKIVDYIKGVGRQSHGSDFMHVIMALLKTSCVQIVTLK